MADEAPASSKSTSMSDQMTSSTLRGVIREQFGFEMVYKEGELEQIEDRIRLAKLMLQRLRLGVLAQHYGVAGFYPTALDYSKENVGVQETWDVFEKEFVDRQKGEDDIDQVGLVQEDECPISNVDIDDHVLTLRSQDSGGQPPLESRDEEEVNISNGIDDSQMDTRLLATNPAPETSHERDSSQATPSHDDFSRFYTKKRIVIGNTSQYLTPGGQQTEDGSTHKWMVYIRGSQEEPDISYFVKAVRFFLHPSYHPNDIVRVSRPPFHLTRLGWGEFPVRVQLEFCDRSNKPIDIIHNLVLDRTHTGQQTLGAETVVDLDIAIKGKEKAGPSLANGLDFPVRVYNKESTFDDKSKKLSIANTKVSMVRSGSMLQAQQRSQMLAMNHEQTVSPTCQSTPSECSTESSGSVQLDHDYCTGVLVKQKGQSSSLKSASQPGLRSSSSMSETRSVVVTTNLDKFLHNAVRAIPMCGAPSEDFMLCANSLEQYARWNLGKRRAAEWMRAVAVRKHVERKLRLGSLLTTKQVMQWCRRNGYTWLDRMPSYGRGFCKYCGCQLENDESSMSMDDSEGEGMGPSTFVHDHCREALFGEDQRRRRRDEVDDSSSEGDSEVDDEGDQGRKEEMTEDPLLVRQKLSSLSECFGIFSNMVDLQKKLDKEERLRIEDRRVDVESLPHSSSARAREYHHHTPKFRVPHTPELKWVQQTAAGLGIRIYPAVIDRMYAHVVEHMIYMSCTRLLRTILMQAVQEGGTRVQGKLNQERILTPFHLHQALRNLELCDFLTNRYMGLRSIAANEVSPDPSSESESESSEEEND